jgi:prepilin-type N-terminal cleavage/methylation domain-containing protein
MSADTARADHSRRRRIAAGNGFTLLEILLVLTILSLVLAVVLPRIGRLPKRLTVERACSAVRLAVVEAGMRARASGTPMKLVLEPEENVFLATPLPATAIGGRSPTARLGGTGVEGRAVEREGGGHILSTQSRYAIPAGVVWSLDRGDGTAMTDEEGRPVYAFYPNGEATGPRAVFTVAGRRFELDVDRLTGKPTIRDLDEDT